MCVQSVQMAAGYLVKAALGIEARARLMVHVNEAGVATPLPVKSIAGSYSSIVTLKTNGGVTKRLMVVLSYIRGTLMSDLVLSPDILQKVGEMAGKLSTSMMGFPNGDLLDYSAVWKMSESLGLLTLIPYSPNTTCQELAEVILKEFKEKVYFSMNQFQKGLIHQDFGPQNILFEQDDKDGSWSVAAILDFGDVCPSYYIFEVATLLAHLFLMKSNVTPLTSNDVESIKKTILDGYTSFISLNDKELEVLDICIQTRLVLCCLLSEQTRTFDPNNSYVNSFIRWDLLENMRGTFLSRK